jgi:hypothetical protein
MKISISDMDKKCSVVQGTWQIEKFGMPCDSAFGKSQNFSPVGKINLLHPCRDEFMNFYH